MNKKMILVSLLAIALVPALSIASEEAAQAAMVTLPKLTLNLTPPLSRLNRAWSAFWPSTPANMFQYSITTNISRLKTETVSAIEGANATQRIMVNNYINPTCSAKGTRLALGALGYWLVKGYRSLNPKISLINGLTQLCNKTSRAQKLKAFGLVAGTVAAAKWVAPFFIKQWQTFTLRRQSNAYEKNLGQAITDGLHALPGNIKENYPLFKLQILSNFTAIPGAQTTINRILPDQR